MGEGLHYFRNHYISRLRYCVAVTTFIGDIIRSLLCLTHANIHMSRYNGMDPVKIVTVRVNVIFKFECYSLFTVLSPVLIDIDKEDDLRGFENGYLVFVVCLTTSLDCVDSINGIISE